MTDATYLDSRRNPAGLAATIALHAGIALIGLYAVTTTFVRVTPAPIITTAIPDTPRPPPVTAPPQTHELAIAADAPIPIWDVDAPKTPESHIDSPPGEPRVAGPDTPPTTVETPTLPPGPTVIARFDRRFGDVQPPYPAAARRLGEEGAVIVHVRIGRDGRVLAATLAQSSGSPRLDAAAIAHALAHWRFTPALRDGTPIEADRDITVSFRLATATV